MLRFCFAWDLPPTVAVVVPIGVAKMRPERQRAESLHGPWPSSIEELQAEHSDKWEIWRDLTSEGRHGDWVARRTSGRQEEVRASTSEELRDLLLQADRRFIQGEADPAETS